MKSWLTIFLVAFVSTLLTTGSGQTEIFKSIGADIVLKPPVPPTSAITRVLWKYGGDLAVEWDGEPNVTEFPHFKGRSYLNRSNGELTLKNLNPDFSGEYAVEINNNPHGLIRLSVISRVPKPQIRKSCTAEKTKCTLTCEGNVTAMNPKPTYIWKFNSTEQTFSHPNFDITPESTSPEYICELKNPVSLESSEPFANPFYESPVVDGLKINTGLIVFACLSAVVLGVVLVHRVKSGMWFFQKDSMPWEAEFWQKTEYQATPEPPPANQEPGERNTMIEGSP